MCMTSKQTTPQFVQFGMAYAINVIYESRDCNNMVLEDEIQISY